MVVEAEASRDGGRYGSRARWWWRGRVRRLGGGGCDDSEVVVGFAGVECVDSGAGAGEVLAADIGGWKSCRMWYGSVVYRVVGNGLGRNTYNSLAASPVEALAQGQTGSGRG